MAMAMFELLDDAALLEMERVTEAATHGPWIVIPERCGPEGQGVYTDPGADCCGGAHVCEVGDPEPRRCNRPEQTMRFIAAARMWVPLLIGEVRRLRTEANRGG